MVLSVYGTENDQVACLAQLSMFVCTQVGCVLSSWLSLTWLSVSALVIINLWYHRLGMEWRKMKKMICYNHNISDLAWHFPIPQILALQNIPMPDLLPVQPASKSLSSRQARERWTTYFCLPILPRPRSFHHLDLLLRTLCLSNPLNCCLLPLLFLFGPLSLELHVPLILLLSFSLCPLPCLMLGLFLGLVFCFLSCFPLPSHLFCPESLNLCELLLELHFEIVIHSDFSKGGRWWSEVRSLSKICSLPEPYIGESSDYAEDLPMGIRP